MRLPEPKIRKSLMLNIEAIVGTDGYSTDARERIAYAHDANFRSAIKSYYGHDDSFPALVVRPATVVQLTQLIKAAVKFNVPLTPYGGGSGVCGAATPENDGIVVDLKRMHRLTRVDESRLFTEAECGIYSLELEKALNRKGFTLGHFPSSIMVATLGGCLAARSAGQLSSKYGKIEDMVIDLEFVDGMGRLWRTADVSRGKGLDFTQALTGCEGTLGFITKARLKIHPLPQHRRLSAFRFFRFEYGAEALRRIMQSGIQPDALRLYDELDTLTIFPKPGKETFPKAGLAKFLPPVFADIKAGAVARFKKIALKFPGLLQAGVKSLNSGCLLIVMLEGHPRLTHRQMELVKSVCESMGAGDEGESPAQHWLEHRYSVSFKAAKLFMDGAFTDTMEVATTWDKLLPLYRGVRRALDRMAVVLAHVSHVYADGAAIYFTFVALLDGLANSLQRYDRIWEAGLNAVQEHGGVISHHHGIGKLKAQHLAREWGEGALVYDRLKTFFDPHDILNPRVLLGRVADKPRTKAV